MTERYSTSQIDQIAGEIGGRIKDNTTPAVVKSRYESNADTNAFTDAEKTKLAGIVPSSTQYEIITGSTYTMTNADFSGNKVKFVVTASPCVITVPVGITNTEACLVIQEGPGSVTFTNDGTSIINSADALMSLRTIYSSASLHRRNLDTFIMVGDLA